MPEFEEVRETLQWRRAAGVLSLRNNRHEILEKYAEWAETYDKELVLEMYRAAEEAAQAIAIAFPDKKQRATAKVMDIAAGTGKIGQKLQTLGFRHVDALDACAEMLNVLKKKECYKRVKLTLIGNGVIDGIKDQYYDAVVISGAFSHGHVPVSALQEMIRMCRIGGCIVISMRVLVLEGGHEEYKDLLPLLQRHQKEGVLHLERECVFPNFFIDFDGIVMTYRRLK